MFVPYKNIYSNICVDFDALDPVVVRGSEKQNKLRYGDVLFTGSSETPEECAMSSVVNRHPENDIYLNSFSFGWRPYDIERFAPDYLKYWFRGKQFRRDARQSSNGVTRFNVSKALLAKSAIPLIDMKEQRRIVSILDNFSDMTTSLTSGLPAEIEARRKQYEYYRDKLLSFPRKEEA